MRQIKSSWVIGLVLVIILLAVMMTFANRENAKRLPAYTKDKTEERKEYSAAKENNPPIDLYSYEDTKTGFSISVPKDWKRVDIGKKVQFIHSPSGTAIQIETENYYPNINNKEQTSLSEEVIAKGYSFVSFNKFKTYAYEVVYQDKKNTTFDYIETVMWDRNSIITITFVVKDEAYDAMLPYMNAVIKSATIKTDHTIPDNLYLYYSLDGAFEFAVPQGWTLGTTKNAYVASNTEIGANMVVRYVENGNSAGDMDMLDMSNLLKEGKQNYMLKSFDVSRDTAIGVASYLSDSRTMTKVQYVFSQAGNWYLLSFDYPEGSLSTESIQSYARFFRCFLANGEKPKAEIEGDISS